MLKRLITVVKFIAGTAIITILGVIIFVIAVDSAFHYLKCGDIKSGILVTFSAAGLITSIVIITFLLLRSQKR